MKSICSIAIRMFSEAASTFGTGTLGVDAKKTCPARECWASVQLYLQRPRYAQNMRHFGGPGRNERLGMRQDRTR